MSSRPDGRTLRYYATLGLLDRPVARRGRVTLYGNRHVAQTIAVKRLQAAGWSLASIQRRLIGLSTDQLLQIHADEAPPITPLSEAPFTLAGSEEQSTEAAPSVPRRQTAFWAAPHVPADAISPLVGLHLGGGAVLLLPTNHPLSTDDAAALREAARPLLAESAARRFLNLEGEVST